MCLYGHWGFFECLPFEYPSVGHCGRRCVSFVQILLLDHHIAGPAGQYSLVVDSRFGTI